MSIFSEKVFEAVKKIPHGRVATYGQLALYAGYPKAARAVGNILHKNPMPIVVPCHRVVNYKGRLAPEFAFGGINAQRKLLENEGVVVSDDGYVDLTKYGYVIK